jgi:CheY-like chemotaxis protein
LSRDGRDAIFQVTDDGQGMPREFLAHVFERFRQADSSATRSYGGLGLGLAITKHLVELHGGTIQAASEGPGRGSTFRVVLPNLLAAQSERPALPHERDHSDADVFLGGVRVLLVEDDPDTRDMVAALLCGTGAEVAMRILESSPIDVLVSDIGLPGEDGYALMTQARALFAEKSRVLPALALTAYASGDDAKRAYVAGFWAHLAKPFEAPVLMHTVARLAQQSRLCPPA